MQLLWSTSYRFFFSFPANLPRFSAFTAFCFTGNSPVLGVCGFPALFAFPGASICWRKVTSSVKRIIQSGWSPNLKPHLHQPELLPPELRCSCCAGQGCIYMAKLCMQWPYSTVHHIPYARITCTYFFFDLSGACCPTKEMSHIHAASPSHCVQKQGWHGSWATNSFTPYVGPTSTCPNYFW